MKSIPTDYGQVHIVGEEELYLETLRYIRQAAENAGSGLAPIGLTGGSTPKAFYQWVTEKKALSLDVAKKILWTTSDERCVPQSDDDSNFGHADREMLSPLGVPSENKLPWPTELEPAACADAYTKAWNERVGKDRAYDVCFVGMGGDNHTLSLFPHCPLIGAGLTESFAATNWPERGWRVTLTPHGLSLCKRIVVSCPGAGKAEALKAALRGDFDPTSKPIQLLRAHADKTVWLVDEAAAALL
ncbi:6-phosphogluconolactonase [Ruficoccus amylovorans]|uniref:6-phosphogluconolactonase n=1 Tax=Ruficoccus amylovorans TaxID=1804625 RepID=A0A842HFT9_9BACT|nr:6-phosphogluconolactonase [Ruficoccus amylovorans]MBC2595070.1 6-phosphogluconolactonase [Ruficoccus amylovorans]